MSPTLRRVSSLDSSATTSASWKLPEASAYRYWLRAFFERPSQTVGVTCGSNQKNLVGEAGLEPAHPFGHWNLNPARLPIPPLARVDRMTLPDGASAPRRNHQSSRCDCRPRRRRNQRPSRLGRGSTPWCDLSWASRPGLCPEAPPRPASGIVFGSSPRGTFGRCSCGLRCLSPEDPMSPSWRSPCLGGCQSGG